MIVYLGVIPATWLYMLSRKTTKYINLISLLGVVGVFFIPNFSQFCNFAFDKCVVFLNDVASLINSDYIRVSVYICVYGVLLVYLILLPICYSKKTTKKVLIVLAIIMAVYLLLIYPNLKSFVQFLMDKNLPVQKFFNPLN